MAKDILGIGCKSTNTEGERGVQSS